MRTITLQSDNTATPNTELRLVVDEEEAGIERWREFRAPKLPPRRTQGALSVSEQDPLIDFTWSQDDWSGGALRPYYRDGDNKYALSNGVDARWEGVMSLGMQRSEPMDYLIRGQYAEKAADATVWSKTESGMVSTLERQDTTVMDDGGSYSYKYYTAQSQNGNQSYYYQDITNASLFRGRVLVVSAWIKTGNLSGNYVPNIHIQDNDGTTATITSAQQSDNTYGVPTDDTDWTFVRVSKTIHASTTQVRIIIGEDGIIGSVVDSTITEFYFDAISVQVDGAGDEVCAGFAEDGGEMYHAQGQVISRWNENDDVWEAVFIYDDTDANATSILHWGGQIWVGFGYEKAYVYGTGSSGGWTKSNLSGTGKYAKYFASARNSAGDIALWKTATKGAIASSASPANGGSWSSSYTIGSADREITGLYGAFDTVIVGKEDGIWTYNRTYANTASAENAFVPVSQEWDNGVNESNFAIGQEWHGYFYTAAASQSFIRYRPGNIADLTSLVMQPRIEGYGGEVKAMVAGPHELWIGADIPKNASAGAFGELPINLVAVNRQCKLISLRTDAHGAFNVHTIDEVNFSHIEALGIYTDTSADPNERFLLAGGRFLRVQTGVGFTEADHPRIYRWQLPVKSAAPYIDEVTPMNSQGTLDTSVWHGGVPGTNKAFLRAVFWVDYLDTSSSTEKNRHIKVTYGLDGENPATNVLGTLYMPEGISDRIQTLYFKDATKPVGTFNPLSDAVGRTIQLRFEFNTSEVGDVDPPRMYAFELHSTLRPKKLRTWELFVRIGQDMIQETGYYNPVSKTRQLSDLDDLEDQVYPIYFKHTYDGHAGFDEEASVNCTIIDRERVSVGDEFEIHKIILQEAETSA